MSEERTLTLRQEIIALLEGGEATVRDISQSVGIREKDVYGHLESVEKSLKHRGKKLHIIPYQCLGCGYLFEDRKKYTRPGKCPKCRKERIDPAVFRIL